MEVHPVEVSKHLVNLSRVLQHCSGGLRQVIERSVATERLSKSAHGTQLQTKTNI